MIRFINHASFVVTADGVSLLCDPWIAGPAFHNAWNLVTEEAHDGLDRVDYIWYSHEHPDHFSLPFLKSIPEERRPHITILYQRTADGRVAAVCRKLGYTVRELSHAKPVDLGGGMRITCGTVPFYDSWALIETPDHAILNTNDCILENPVRLSLIHKHVERCDILFTQFSYANWQDSRYNPQARRDLAQEKLRRIKIQCEAFQPHFVVPFASFVYFSHVENAFMNADINTPAHAVAFIEAECEAIPVLLIPNEEWDGQTAKSNAAAIAWWARKYSEALGRTKRVAQESYDWHSLSEKADRMIARVKARNNYALITSMQRLGLVEKVDFQLIDGNRHVSFDWISGLCRLDEPSFRAIEIHSESLAFIFDNDFGVDTVNVNARFEGAREDKQRMIRLFSVLALNNTGRFVKIGQAGRLFDREFLQQGLRTIGMLGR
jgi:hypothetical protein